jgi:hypothetical protein
MIPNLNTSILEWIAKNRMVAIIIILLAGNVYQYIDYRKYEELIRKETHEFYIKSVEYERDRSQKLESLLTKLLNKKIKSDETSDSE